MPLFTDQQYSHVEQKNNIYDFDFFFCYKSNLANLERENELMYTP